MKSRMSPMSRKSMVQGLADSRKHLNDFSSYGLESDVIPYVTRSIIGICIVMFFWEMWVPSANVFNGQAS